MKTIKNIKMKAFTLIELLIVIAIIGILAAGILVGLGGARQDAKNTATFNSVSSALSVVMQCLDKGATVSTPANNARICSAVGTSGLTLAQLPADNWPDLSINGWAWNSTGATLGCTAGFTSGTGRYCFGANHLETASSLVVCDSSNATTAKCRKSGW